MKQDSELSIAIKKLLQSKGKVSSDSSGWTWNSYRENESPVAKMSVGQDVWSTQPSGKSIEETEKIFLSGS